MRDAPPDHLATHSSQRRTLITGATGFVGSWLTHRLVADGDEVAVLVRSTSDLWRLEPIVPRLRLIKAGLSQVAAVAEQIVDFAPQRVFHLAWTGGNSAKYNDDPAQVYENVPGSLDLMRVAAEAGASFFLNLGSCVEYGECSIPVRETDAIQPKNLYGAAKHAVEDLLLRLGAGFGVRTASVRLFWSYGPGDDEARLIPSLTRKLLRNERHSMTPATQMWDFLYITDVVEALVQIAATPKAQGVFNLGSGRPQPLREVAETLRHITKSTALIGFGDIPFPPGQMMHLEADVTRLQETVGWSPRVSIEAGLAETVAWYRSGANTLPVETLESYHASQ